MLMRWHLNNGCYLMLGTAANGGVDKIDGGVLFLLEKTAQ
jgi:hypothetical protein